MRYKKVFSLLFFFCFSSSTCYRVPLLVNIAIARPHELGGLSHLQGGSRHFSRGQIGCSHLGINSPVEMKWEKKRLLGGELWRDTQDCTQMLLAGPMGLSWHWPTTISTSKKQERTLPAKPKMWLRKACSWPASWRWSLASLGGREFSTTEGTHQS